MAANIADLLEKDQLFVQGSSMWIVHTVPNKGSHSTHPDQTEQPDATKATTTTATKPTAENYKAITIHQDPPHRN